MAEARLANDDALIRTLEMRFKERPADEWEAALTSVRVGCVEVNMKGLPYFLGFDEVLQQTSLTTRYDHPLFGALVGAAPPVKFSRTPVRHGLPCARAADNRAILAEVEYSDEQIADLEAREVVIPPLPGW